MRYNIKAYQVVLPEKNEYSEKRDIWRKGLFEEIPTIQEFKFYYDPVITLEIESDAKDEMELCEHCFYILNDPDFGSREDVISYEFLNKCRSLSVGDILEINNRLFLVRDIGFLEYSLGTAKSIG